MACSKLRLAVAFAASAAGRAATTGAATVASVADAVAAAHALTGQPHLKLAQLVNCTHTICFRGYLNPGLNLCRRFLKSDPSSTISRLSAVIPSFTPTVIIRVSSSSWQAPGQIQRSNCSRYSRNFGYNSNVTYFKQSGIRWPRSLLIHGRKCALSNFLSPPSNCRLILPFRP